MFVDTPWRALAADRLAHATHQRRARTPSELGIVAERGLLGLAELAAIIRRESDQ